MIPTSARRPGSLMLCLPACTLLLLACALPAAPSHAESPAVVLPAKAVPGGRPVAGMGIMVGELTARSALVQVRLTKTDKPVDRDVPGAAGVVRFKLQRVDEDAEVEAKPLTQTVPARAKRDFIARASFTGLQPGARYRVATQIGDDAAALRPGPTAAFKTLPGAERAEAVRLAVVTGMNYAKFHGDDRIDREQHLIENNTELRHPTPGRTRNWVTRAGRRSSRREARTFLSEPATTSTTTHRINSAGEDRYRAAAKVARTVRAAALSRSVCRRADLLDDRRSRLPHRRRRQLRRLRSDARQWLAR